MTREGRIAECLTTTFRPVTLEIEDQSALHAGHAGARPEGETHFRVRMVAESFDELSRLDRHRRVMESLAGEFSTGLHALNLELMTPAEV